MTIEQIVALAKEKLGKDIGEQEALDYLDGQIALPDEALELVGGGSFCSDLPRCPVCGDTLGHFKNDIRLACTTCGYHEDIEAMG